MARPRTINEGQISHLVGSLFEEDLHAKRILSLSQATLGAVEAAALGVHAIGLGLAAAKGLNAKHTTKQVDRLLSNQGIEPWNLFGSWVPFVVASRPEVVVALDWTDFDADGQSTLALHLITGHGRATPLMWMTVEKATLAGWRNGHEDALLTAFAAYLPKGVKATVLADRGFGDQELYRLLVELGLDFVIRFRENILVTDEGGEARRASEWVPDNGRPRLLRNARVTQDHSPVAAVVCVKARGMKDAWCLASSRSDLPASRIVALYGKRFTIEESFRDTKDIHFGMGLSSTHISMPERRDRLLLISALAVALITLLGAAGESLGWERLMKANTVKTRTYSLYRQGLHYYASIPAMKDEKLAALTARFRDLMMEHQVCREVFGVL